MDLKPPGSAFRRGIVPSGEFHLQFAEAGPEDPVATLVSFPGSAGLEMSTAKDRLARRYRVVEINPPGFGGTDDLTRPIDMGELGAVLLTAATRLVDGPFYLVGTSMGGVSAIHAAAAEPARVRGVVLEGGMAPAEPDDLIVPPPPPPSAQPEQNDAAPSGGPEDYPLPPAHPSKPWATEEFIRNQMANRVKMFRWVQLDMLPTEALAKVADNATPVLALLGSEDEIIRPTQRDAFTRFLPHADFRLVPGGAHDLQNTTPEEFVALVDSFVAAHG